MEENKCQDSPKPKHFVCPRPWAWQDVWNKCRKAWSVSGEASDGPPQPYVLGMWWGTSDQCKHDQWRRLISWTGARGLGHLIPEFAETDRYEVEAMSTGCPDVWVPHSSKSHPPAATPSCTEAKEAFEKLVSRWKEITAGKLGGVLRPIRFSGKRRRRLLVKVAEDVPAPWGSWTFLPHRPARHLFSEFRREVNRAINPHKVDHIDFDTSLLKANWL